MREGDPLTPAVRRIGRAEIPVRDEPLRTADGEVPVLIPTLRKDDFLPVVEIRDVDAADEARRLVVALAEPAVVDGVRAVELPGLVRDPVAPRARAVRGFGAECAMPRTVPEPDAPDAGVAAVLVVVEDERRVDR